MQAGELDKLLKSVLIYICNIDNGCVNNNCNRCMNASTILQQDLCI